MIARSTFIVFASILSVACGGIADQGDAGNPDGGPGPGPQTTCPSALPSIGDACGREGLACEYGNDSRTTCNTITICEGGKWDTTFSNDPSCPTTNDKSCPASLGGVDQGGACPSEGAACDYSNSIASNWCTCGFQGGPPIEVDGGGPQFTWQCSYGTSSGCPAVRPRIGTTCAQPNVECDYSICGAPSGLSVQCDSNLLTWVVGFGSVCAGAN